MRGRTLKTPEAVAEAVAMVNDGKLLREIAQHFGIAISTAQAWVTDPDGSKLAARKDTYRGRCTICGRRTDGSNGRDRSPTECKTCRTWTRETVLAAFADWFEAHGMPPRTVDAIGSNSALPHQQTVARIFGSWGDALEALDLPILCDRRDSVWADLRRRYEAGETAHVLAAERGCSAQNIWNHMQAHGVRSGYMTNRRWSDEEMVEAYRRSSPNADLATRTSSCRRSSTRRWRWQHERRPDRRV